MTLVGYHASHEQFTPGALLELVRRAELAGFDAAKCSDHFHPWSDRQGQSGFAWSWLGAAMQATSLPMGNIAAAGYRYHPAVLAQAAATLGAMFPGRFWLSLGSGEAINEAITGLPWPDKAERNAMLAECASVVRSLLEGRTVTHRGRVTVIEARLYTLPDHPVPVFGAAVTAETARSVAEWADGLLTVGGDPDTVGRVVDAFRGGGGAGKPVYVQHALSWADSAEAAMANALDQWRPVAVGGEVNWDLRRPSDFDRLARFVTQDDLAECVRISADRDEHRRWIADLIDLGVDAVFLHNVGRNQEEFIDAFGASVLPALRSQP